MTFSEASNLYRVSYDQDLGLKTRAFTSPAEGEAILYETCFRRMRQTGETKSKPRCCHPHGAYPLLKKLHTQLFKYPQEVIPAMDQALKDLMLDIADMDHQAGLEGMQGAETARRLAISWERCIKPGLLDFLLST